MRITATLLQYTVISVHSLSYKLITYVIYPLVTSNVLTDLFCSGIGIPTEDMTIWEMLEVDEDASTQKIRQAYRRKSLQWHPGRLIVSLFIAEG